MFYNLFSFAGYPITMASLLLISTSGRPYNIFTQGGVNILKVFHLDHAACFLLLYLVQCSPA